MTVWLERIAGRVFPNEVLRARYAIGLGLLGLGAAHSPLLFFDPGNAALPHLEDVFYEPTSAAPLFVLGCWLWMLWVRRARLAGFAGREWPAMGGVAFLASGALCGWARYTGVDALLVLSLALCSLASALMLAGPSAARTLLYPAAFLLLAMPVPTPVVNAILHPLQLANAKAAGTVLALFGFDVTVSGDLIFVDDAIAQVIEGCAGLRSVLTLLMAACIYTELTWHDRRRTLALIGLSPLLALVTNHLRILSIILNPYATISTVHTFQGLATITVGVILLACLDVLLDRLWPTEREPHLVVEPPLGLVSRTTAWGFTGLCFSLAIISLAGPRWQPPPGAMEPSLGGFRNVVPGYALSGWKPDFAYLGSVRFDAFLAHRSLRKEQPEVRMLIGADHRLEPMLGLGSRKAALPGRGAVELVNVPRPASPMDGVEVLLVRMPGSEQLVYFWEVGQESLPVETLRAVFGVDRSPFRREGRAAFVRLSTPIGGEAAGMIRAQNRLREYFEALKAEFHKLELLPGDQAFEETLPGSDDPGRGQGLP